MVSKLEDELQSPISGFEFWLFFPYQLSDLGEVNFSEDIIVLSNNNSIYSKGLCEH